MGPIGLTETTQSTNLVPKPQNTVWNTQQKAVSHKVNRLLSGHRYSKAAGAANDVSLKLK